MVEITETNKHGTVEGVENVNDSTSGISVPIEKISPTAYLANHESSHHKSKAERGMILKADLLIVPLCALLYFVAYLV